MNDLDLWQQLKQGNKKALERIYAEQVVALLQYGKKFSGDVASVEDCIQDLFIELWKNRAGLSPTDSIRRYLFVALRRKIIRFQERKGKYLSGEEPQEYQFEAEISIDLEIIQKEQQSEQLEQLKQALQNLSTRQKEIIYLKYQVGMDYEAITKVMDISYQSARNLVGKALNALKKQLILWVAIFFDFFFT